jgi:hypothetical protein
LYHRILRAIRACYLLSRKTLVENDEEGEIGSPTPKIEKRVPDFSCWQWKPDPASREFGSGRRVDPILAGLWTGAAGNLLIALKGARWKRRQHFFRPFLIPSCRLHASISRVHLYFMPD